MARDHKPSRRRAHALAASVAALAIGGTALAEVPVSAAGKPRGHDVSSHQKNVDWPGAKAKGARFVYVKATESHTYRNPYFRQQYDGSRAAGLVRGAYHFALPHRSSGAAQAAHFMRNGGQWTPDGWTLPPALDIEHHPYGGRKCYGLSKARMVAWIQSFSDEVRRRSGRRPVIYTTTKWWNDCTGASRAFGGHPLWLARWSAAPGPLPSGWSSWAFWQYADRGTLPGDQNLFNGSTAQLRRFARG
ncbi:lysozyme [Streptomyces spectabilis]|uniref:lysozyme n=1 Tax=Streptomyces spectabilis TaxID=68270 RepID=A0A5P2X832_STRST|nr:lysozyme [Streptomyces spectabilis]MBB5108532.1 lysozyme [Streptomyces spectabilis]MCI3901747.1 lysozyme [Streptomyces spectabilis]QEV59180.1 hydrolase [Streptomyces spectabilis]GGV47342.1 lysozyme [Streptomyces spectabilis]